MGPVQRHEPSNDVDDRTHGAYGDVYPITVGGKLFTTVLLLVGLSVVAIPTGIFSTALMSARGSQTPDEDA